MNASYRRDLLLAAESAPYFDAVNAKQIGDDHGEDPRVVLREIKELRAAYSGN